MRKLIEILSVVVILFCLVVALFLFAMSVGCDNEPDKGWRLTEDGCLEIYKDGVTITGCTFEGELDPNAIIKF